MKSRNQSNALLIELLIVVLFFALSGTVLLQVFTASSTQSQRASVINEALVAAQNVAERLCAVGTEEEKAVEALTDMGFQQDGDSGWEQNRDDYCLRVTMDMEKRDAGQMLQATIEASRGEEILFALPAARYEEAHP